MSVIERRLVIASGVLLAVLGATAWSAVTANAIAGGIVVSDLGAPPLIGLSVGTALSQGMLVMFILLVLPGGRLEAMTRARIRVIALSVFAALVATPLLTLSLWNIHAHRIDSHVIDLLGEGALVLGAVSAAFAGLGMVSARAWHGTFGGR